MAEIKTLREEKNPINLDPVKVRYQRENGSWGTRTVIPGNSMTQQQFKDDCDANIMIAKFLKTGDSAHLKLRDVGVYADLADAPDYLGAMQTIVNAQTAFDALPAKLRLEKFNNDPSKMLSYLSDPKNQEEAISLGLMNRLENPVDPNKSVVDAVNSLSAEIKNTRKKRSAESAEE